MPNAAPLAPAPTFDQYCGENRFVFRDITYESKGLLGKGTTASVYRFHPIDPTLSSESVAVKVELPVTHKGVERFEEGQTFFFDAYWNQQIYGLGVLSGDLKHETKAHYLLMPYFAGVLASDISLRGARELVEWFIMVARFIHEKMHVEKEAVHGDIKMDNVIFQASEKKAYVIDFGLTEKIGGKIGQYFIPPTVNPVLSLKKLSSTKYCPQTAPELFGKEQVPAEPSQDAYGLGQLIFSLLGKTTHISSDQRSKLCFVMSHLRATRPQDRWSIPFAMSKLNADFIAVVPRLIAHRVEPISNRPTLCRHRHVMPDQDANSRVAIEGAPIPLLTKAMADNQFRLTERQVGSRDVQTEGGVLRFPPAPHGALAAPAASSSEKNNGVDSSGEKSGRCVEGTWGYFFVHHSVPKQNAPHEKPARSHDRHL